MRSIAAAAAFLFLAVALGAFGAHGLRERLAASGHASTWETAVLYQALHGLALLGTGVWRCCDRSVAGSRALGLGQALWAVGIVLFSGSLYVLALGGPRWLGPVTPLGGACFLAGWLVLGAYAALRAGAR